MIETVVIRCLSSYGSEVSPMSAATSNIWRRRPERRAHRAVGHREATERHHRRANVDFHLADADAEVFRLGDNIAAAYLQNL
jgi:hypothetical protein